MDGRAKVHGMEGPGVAATASAKQMGSGWTRTYLSPHKEGEKS